MLVAMLVASACGRDALLSAEIDDPTRSATPTSTATTTAPRPPTTTTTTVTAATSTAATTTSSTTTTTTLALPQPIAPPADDHAPEPRIELGTIEIPAIGLSSPLLEGIRLTTLDAGPGHWPGTAMPGQIGNVVVAGHRVSHGQHFRHLDDLAPGDEVRFTTADGAFTYHVTATEIVAPDAIWIVDQTPMPTATLFACHPPGSTRQRIVVHLELAG
jgi:sortase A